MKDDGGRMKSEIKNQKSAFHNWMLYRRLVGAQLRSQMQYRVSFLFDFVAQFAGNVVDFAVVAVFFTRTPTLGGWSLGEVGLLYGLSSISFALADMLGSGFDYGYFGPTMVRLGGFDQLLVRPVNLFLQVLAAQFVLRRIGRIVQGALILILALSLLDVAWTPLKIGFMVITIAGGVFFFMGLFIFGSGVSFWTVDSLEAINIVTYGGQMMTSYPMHIYQDWLRSIFMFIIPMAFVNYYPALWLLGKPDPLGGPTWLAFLSPFVCLIVFGLGIRMWFFGARRYQSTGS
ncbi:MAG TPA: ABC-2 family transporter protein [Anaerolineae bacterium]|nr:ABC-2 family transporter protein [Anaerolineae bacterium]